MYKLLYLLPLLLLLSSCAEQTRGISLNSPSKTQVSAYSLEALDANYHKHSSI